LLDASILQFKRPGVFAVIAGFNGIAAE
jgi:hypothetical protein